MMVLAYLLMIGMGGKSEQENVAVLREILMRMRRARDGRVV